MRDNKSAQLLAYITVNQRLLLKCENPIAKTVFNAPTSRENSGSPTRSAAHFAEIGKRLGRKRLKQVACVAKLETIQA